MTDVVVELTQILRLLVLVKVHQVIGQVVRRLARVRVVRLVVT